MSKTKIQFFLIKFDVVDKRSCFECFQKGTSADDKQYLTNSILLDNEKYFKNES